MADKNQALTILQQGIVLDRTIFRQFGADLMAETITAISNNKKPLLVVDDAEQFFTVENLIKLVQLKDGRFNLVAEKLGGAQNVVVAPQVVQEVLEAVEAPQAPANAIGGYQFAEVPDGWSIGNNMSLGQTKIKRKLPNGFGDGTEFYLSPAQFLGLWSNVSKYWANIPKASQSMMLTTPLGRKTAYFTMDKVTVGGHTLRRYEIEQVAKHRGWVFPEQIAA